jgi:hypothetical protein
MTLMRPDPAAREPPTAIARDKARSLLTRTLGASKVRTERDDCEAFANDDSDTAGRSAGTVKPVTTSASATPTKTDNFEAVGGNSPNRGK